MKYKRINVWDALGSAVGELVEKGQQTAMPLTEKAEIIISKGKDEVNEIIIKGKESLLSSKKDAEKDIKNIKIRKRLEDHLKLNELVEKLKALKLKTKSREELDDSVIALFGVAFSVANCDGEMHPDEIKDIEMFVSGASFKMFPEFLKSKILELKNNPPNFNTAMEYVKRLPKENVDMIDDIIEIVVVADDVVRQEEKAYLLAWQKFKEDNFIK
jgi:uncharacterized tellurite resistance protein B-like protein